jgi:hypothetical protein
MLLGLVLGAAGCASALASDASLSGVGATLIFGGAVVILCVPGFVLVASKHRLRWLGQLVPAAITLWTIVSLAR